MQQQHIATHISWYSYEGPSVGGGLGFSGFTDCKDVATDCCSQAACSSSSSSEAVAVGAAEAGADPVPCAAAVAVGAETVAGFCSAGAATAAACWDSVPAVDWGCSAGLSVSIGCGPSSAGGCACSGVDASFELVFFAAASCTGAVTFLVCRQAQLWTKDTNQARK